MIFLDYLGKMGQLGNQMFQYAALRGIAKHKGYDFGIPDHDELIVDAWDMEGQPIEPMIMFTPDFEIKPPTQTNLTLVKGEDDDDEK